MQIWSTESLVSMNVMERLKMLIPKSVFLKKISRDVHITDIIQTSSGARIRTMISLDSGTLGEDTCVDIICELAKKYFED